MALTYISVELRTGCCWERNGCRCLALPVQAGSGTWQSCPDLPVWAVLTSAPSSLVLSLLRPEEPLHKPGQQQGLSPSSGSVCQPWLTDSAVRGREAGWQWELHPPPQAQRFTSF